MKQLRVSGGADYDLLVVGAGVLGLLSAWLAVKAGQRVAVVERSSGSLGASIRNFGHIGVTAQGGIALEYSRRSRELWLQLAEEAGFWIQAKGATIAARSAREMQVLKKFAEERDSEEVILLGRTQILERTAVRDERLTGGAWLPKDLQVDSREALPAIALYLQQLGVDFRWRTSVESVHSGGVRTSRGELSAAKVLVTVNYDVDQFFPEIAEQAGLQRCSLQMLSLQVPSSFRLDTPLLTGWSMVRYAGLADLPGLQALKKDLSYSYPELKAIDLNQMYALRPNGELVVGDSHALGDDPEVFQSEETYRLLLEVTQEIFGLAEVSILSRWQGVYASARKQFLFEEALEDVWVMSVTTGIGMSTGPGFVEGSLRNMGLLEERAAEAVAV